MVSVRVRVRFFFTARRYASAVCYCRECVTVCVCHTPVFNMKRIHVSLAAILRHFKQTSLHS